MNKSEPNIMAGKMMQSYMNNLLPHGNSAWHDNPVTVLDTLLRNCIGKTDGIEIGKCSHPKIIQRQLNASGKNLEQHCRCCGMNLNKDGIMRCNDFLIFRNKNCPGPICGDCFTNKPDIWYRIYIKGLKKYRLLRDELHSLSNSN